ncbi:sugar ABC transporter [Escherichia coli]|nr:sugar ABC transporter [Escherichia marmotae]EFO1363206.1 sugar ABC transporter [Escherichia coli]PSS41597.1 sugar ABC transporter [Escherichia sp. MOD1-EC5451]EGE0246713.1 sugar ABC transporter [Escherichia coli]PGF74220.1 sugar ABC transporter [Escherichia marmotae]
MLLAKNMAILCAPPRNTAISATQITQNEGGA